MLNLSGSAAVCNKDLGEGIRETGVVKSYERSGLVDVSSQLEKLKHVKFKEKQRERQIKDKSHFLNSQK